ncbi:ATP-binding protein [Nesterenkonia alkaliphila]|uniref:DUF4143 domain-containing protein n=1 Tax=Nesterenkonia alkaliphila TaxID=1463631 RepID=A0A7K1UEP6_9MICC|nr:ATP-binding protein [Nesterenkonia alkaliphila]MVT24955.1 DUF4143 domain-containing protein [Nesterenkonia alkaliphila]
MMSALTAEVPRRLEEVVRARLRETPVLVISGPRTVGKSTVLRALAQQLEASILDLDDLATRELVEDDPGYFMSGEPPILVDEYQRVPQVLAAIKAELNKGQSPGQYLLTGSTRYGSLPQVATYLTGRVQTLDLYPLSQGEISGTHESFLETALRNPAELVSRDPSRTTREEYTERVCAGGFPVALRSPSVTARRRWYNDFINLVVTKDVVELTRIRQRAQLPHLLRRLASQTGQLVNMSEVSQDVKLDRSTAERYTTLLEAVFLVHRLPAWGTTLGSRITRNPKLHMVDTGVAAHLLGLTPQKLAARNPSALTEFGHLLETFAVNEVMKQATWSEELIELGHFHTHDHDEVDLVLETYDGRVLGIEVKASGRVPGKDFSALRMLGRKAGSRFLGGIVLYLGSRSYSYEDNLHALPLDTLWQPGRQQ